MVGLVPTIHVFAGAGSCSGRGCSPQGRAWRERLPRQAECATALSRTAATWLAADNGL